MRLRPSIVLSFFVLLALLSIAKFPSGESPQMGDGPRAMQLSPIPQLGNPIIEYSVPTADSGPESISAGPNQTLWFTEYQTGKIGSMLTNGSNTREWAVAAGSHPATITVDQKGMVWFTDENNVTGAVWRFNPSNASFNQFLPSDPKTVPIFILVDSLDNVWFTEVNTNKIGRLAAPNYTLTEYTLPTAQSGPTEMALQTGTPYLWITEQYLGSVVRFDTTTYTFQEFSPTVVLRYPVGIVVDNTGSVWVSEHGGSSLTEFQPSSSKWTKYVTSISPSVQQGYSAPATLSIDELGRLWFVEHFANRVGRLSPPGSRSCVPCQALSSLQANMQEFAIPGLGAYSLQDALDENGNFWFTEFYANKIGMVPSNASSPVAFQSGVRFDTIQATAGLTATTRMILYTDLTSAQVSLSASSSFSDTGQTPQSEISFIPSSLNLVPGIAGYSSNIVSVSITPGVTFSSRLYSVSLAVTYGNFTNILIVMVQVKSVADVLVSYLPEIAIGVAAIVASTALLLRRRRFASSKGNEGSKENGRGSSVTTAAILLSIISLLLLGRLPNSGIVLGKCPGLPPPPVGNNFGSGGDPYNFYVDIASITLVAVVLLIVGWKVLKNRGKTDPIGF